MFNYVQVKHTKTGDVLGQTLTFENVDQYLLEYHAQMKNAINNQDVLGMSILVLDEQLHHVFSDNWVRYVEPVEPEPEEEPEEDPEDVTP